MVDDPRRPAAAFAELLTDRCAASLGNQLFAAMLHGSLAHGDFAAGRSDIDLLLIVERPLTTAETVELRRTVEQLGAETPTRVDLRLVTRATAAAPTRSAGMEVEIVLQPGTPPSIATHVTDEPDLIVELSVVRATGRAMVGPTPETVIGVVPDDWVIEVGARQLAAWERLVDDDVHAELMVLTTCRIWRFGVERVHCTKSEAGRWALARDASLSAIDGALRRRAGNQAVIRGDEISRLIQVVVTDLAARETKDEAWMP